MSWIVLVVAGLFEVVWASLLAASRGFTRPLPTAGFLVALVCSMWLLSVATRTIPVGTAYAVWVGIGALGTFLVAVVGGQRTSPAQLAAVAVLVTATIAVKLTAPH